MFLNSKRSRSGGRRLFGSFAGLPDVDGFWSLETVVTSKTRNKRGIEEYPKSQLPTLASSAYHSHSNWKSRRQEAVKPKPRRHGSCPKVPLLSGHAQALQSRTVSQDHFSQLHVYGFTAVGDDDNDDNNASQAAGSSSSLLPPPHLKRATHGFSPSM